MELSSSGVLIVLLLMPFCFCSEFVAVDAIDTITASQPLRYPGTITSSDSAFKLGFFSPVNSTNHYLGIWYNDKSEAVIWVANRNRPLKDASGVVTISEDGNLVVLNGQKEVLWLSNVSNPVTNASAQVLGSGNLVLSNNTSGSIWESFGQPTDTLMRRMKLSTDTKTGKKIQLTSWTSNSDPSIGSFSAGISLLNMPQIFIWKTENNQNLPFWRSGHWNGREIIGMSDVNFLLQIVKDNEEGSFSITVDFSIDPSIYIILSPQGRLIQRDQVNGKDEWTSGFKYPQNECDIYGRCGSFGICDANRKPICSCLRGLEPKNLEEWNGGNWTGGCVRSTPLQCEIVNKTNGEANKEDGFLKLGMIKVPDFPERTSAAEDKCREICLNNCSCIAYAYDVGIGCMSWRDNLTDVQQFYNKGTDFYVRVAPSERAADKKEMKVASIVPVVVGTVAIAICAFFLWRWMAKRKAPKDKSRALRKDTSSVENLSEVELQDLPLFDFEKLATATNNFHLTNKLGQGGFGPVYKGELEDGKEIAVKRLSNASGQGLAEFKNEVMVISKLQHRNLVRLLGCCVDREEKILIYEYMPNKSLDAFLFDQLEQELLDWRKRFNIIEGISRGLLYLHRDSRLRIIHRDLKPSNILLDKELNPKISDFGMARIFGGNEDQANTKRVVGTYGYMSPEYVMEGHFSEKSDVFSFGVLLLEIVSGRKNTGFYHDAESLSLLGYAWKLWNENNIVALIHPVISNPCFQSEISRCIHVGLLCVEKFMKDRPSMPTVISMLNSEIVDLPTPKQPAFTERCNAGEESSQQNQKRCSINNVTVTVIEGR